MWLNNLLGVTSLGGYIATYLPYSKAVVTRKHLLDSTLNTRLRAISLEIPIGITISSLSLNVSIGVVKPTYRTAAERERRRRGREIEGVCK